MERWVGKVALVTGASAGIGSSIAEELAKSGLKVVGLARRVEKVEALKANLKDAKGELIALKGDVSKLEDVEAAFRFVKEKFGTIHVLVNNAGIGRNGTISETADIKQIQEVVNVNLVGLTACTQQAVKLMRSTGVDDGHIININSIAGHYIPNMPEPTFNIYSATKHGVTALTEVVRQELRFYKTKIRITSVSPGAVATEIFEASAKASGVTRSKEEIEEGLKRFALFPKLEPKDVADAVTFALAAPPHVQISELIIKPVGEPF